MPMRIDRALVVAPHMRTEFVLLTLELALTCTWGCESRSLESSELKCARVSCVCFCVVVADNLNADARRSGSAIKRHISVIATKK